MAAQRLVAILIALLVVSSLLAVINPRPQADPAEETEPTTTETTPERGPEDGELIEREFSIDPKRKTITLDAAVGDRLQLTITSEETRQVRLDPLGQLETVARASPVRFDVILRDPGTVALVSSDLADPIATFEVGEADPSGQDDPPGTQVEPADAE